MIQKVVRRVYVQTADTKINSFTLSENIIHNARFKTCCCIQLSIDFEPPTTMAKKPLAEISRLDLKEISVPVSACITDVQRVESYN